MASPSRVTLGPGSCAPCNGRSCSSKPMLCSKVSLIISRVRGCLTSRGFTFICSTTSNSFPSHACLGFPAPRRDGSARAIHEVYPGPSRGWSRNQLGDQVGYVNGKVKRRFTGEPDLTGCSENEAVADILVLPGVIQHLYTWHR